MNFCNGFSNVHTIQAKEPKDQEPKDGFCQHCGQYFKMLEQHIKYKHESNKPWKCDQCDYSHALRSGLKAHIRYSHPVEKDLKVCHICGFTSASASIVKIHIQGKHEKKRRFSCRQCDLKFLTNSSMKKHIRGQHLNEKNYKCEQCDEAFKYCSTLRHHVRKVHEGIRYKCVYCGTMYDSKKSFMRHNQDKHKAEEKQLNTLEMLEKSKVIVK